MWAEHFDPPVEIGDAEARTRASNGASPGDTAHDEPYLYVTAWGEIERSDPYWNDEAFNGTSISHAALAANDDPRRTALTFLREGLGRLRASAGRCGVGAPSVAVVEESCGDQHGGGEAEGGVSVAGGSVCVSAELSVVRPPRVGGFDDPAESEGEPVWPARFGFGASFLDVEIGDSSVVETGAGLGVVIAAVQ